jgi:hypothetical protein
VVQLQQLAAKFLLSTKDFPPGRIAGSFDLVKIQKKIEINAGSKKTQKQNPSTFLGGALFFNWHRLPVYLNMLYS